MGNQGLQNIIKHPMVWDCLGHMSPQSQNPEHSSAVAIIGYRFFGGPHIAFQCFAFAPLSLFGGAYRFTVFRAHL